MRKKEEYNSGWKLVEKEFHSRVEELFDFHFRRRLGFETDAAPESHPTTNKNHKKEKL